MQVVDFIEVRKWLQKGSILQRYSNLSHDPLIPHQSNWGGAVRFQGIGERVILEQPVVGPVWTGRGIAME